ncbi:hypothetical protein C489_11780 [Natrinema versiforme JCM 10478]|uniref:Uncharacterized protein n=1 Tax=Natrinema versiforme JCM 10478 TaxID=1227496 RepID=L9Y097_9EURY|nr:hypothetical protein C489_11780 [Natrinema versiforme JCM 10478]
MRRRRRLLSCGSPDERFVIERFQGRLRSRRPCSVTLPARSPLARLPALCGPYACPAASDRGPDKASITKPSKRDRSDMKRVQSWWDQWAAS